MSKKLATEEEQMDVPMKISETVIRRLESGARTVEVNQSPETVNEQQLMDEEKIWIQKLTSLDAEHTNKNLDMNEIERILRDVARCAKVHPKNCPMDKFKLTECLVENKGNTLACKGEVENFKNCVDKLLYEAVRGITEDLQKNNKITYAQKFEQKY